MSGRLGASGLKPFVVPSKRYQAVQEQHCRQSCQHASALTEQRDDSDHFTGALLQTPFLLVP